MKLIRILRGDLRGRELVYDDATANQMVKQGDAEYANDTLEYLTREMTAAPPKKRGRPKKAEEETPADED